jgi:putative transposase
MRCSTILIQIYEAEGVQILKGVVSKDDVYMHIEYRPSQDVSILVKLMKGYSSRKLQIEFPDLKKKILGSSFFGNRFWMLEYW